MMGWILLGGGEGSSVSKFDIEQLSWLKRLWDGKAKGGETMTK